MIESGQKGNWPPYVELPSIQHRRSSKKKLKPITANLIDTQYEVVFQVCEELEFDIVYEKQTKNWDIKWTDAAVSVEMLSKLQQYQKINHFPGMNVLSRKNNLAKNILKMQAAFPEYYSFVPKTFLLPTELPILRNYYNQSRRRGVEKTFIVKPEAGCQGRGIFLTQSLTEIEEHGQCVVQSYVSNPLLYKGLKFDMRIYALVAGCDPLRIYIYNEGLVRFATEQYDPPNQENMDNLYIHLTNYAINKDSPKYVFNESLDNLSHGHKKSLAEFFQTLKGMGHPAHEYWGGIKDTIVKTVISGQPHLQHQYRMAQPHNYQNNMCFEILGFDFMIDDKDKLYLLEINYTPSFSTETPLDELIKSNLIRDTLLIMDVTPESRNKAQKQAKEELDRRVFTGKSSKLTPSQRESVVRVHQKARDQYEKKHLGSFQRIFPSKNPERQSRYEQFLAYSAQQYKQVSSPQKYGMSKRMNSKYRIKRIISSNTSIQQEILREKKHLSLKKNDNMKQQQSPQQQHRRKAHINEQYISITANPQTAIGGIRKNIYNQPITRPRHDIHGELYHNLETKNQQLTMFSKGFRNEQTSA